MDMREWIAVGLLVMGILFFLSGTIGLLRFPDVDTRLHALTKADTLGLGLVALGLAVQSETVSGAIKHLLVWLLVLGTSATICFLIANQALQSGQRPWNRDEPFH
jgi:multicomponent Na+:H+ antiporter subunit G